MWACSIFFDQHPNVCKKWHSIIRNLLLIKHISLKRDPIRQSICPCKESLQIAKVLFFKLPVWFLKLCKLKKNLRAICSNPWSWSGWRNSALAAVPGSQQTKHLGSYDSCLTPLATQHPKYDGAHTCTTQQHLIKTWSCKNLNPTWQITWRGDYRALQNLKIKEAPEVSSMMDSLSQVQPMLVLCSIHRWGWCSEWQLWCGVSWAEPALSTPGQCGPESAAAGPGAIQSAVSSQQRDTEHSAL